MRAALASNLIACTSWLAGAGIVLRFGGRAVIPVAIAIWLAGCFGLMVADWIGYDQIDGTPGVGSLLWELGGGIVFGLGWCMVFWLVKMAFLDPRRRRPMTIMDDGATKENGEPSTPDS